jgi:hypothetical protein
MHILKAIILPASLLCLSIPVLAQTQQDSKSLKALKLAEAFNQTSQSSLQLTSATIKQDGSNPLLEVTGKGFGKDPNTVKVVLNDNGVLLTPSLVKNKKLQVQIPNGDLCTGNVTVRVLVGTSTSNIVNFDYQKLAPVIYSIMPTHAQAGSAINIKADNLACQMNNNLVTINDSPVSVLGVTTDGVTVRLPDTLTAGKVNVRVTVGSQSSTPTDFLVDQSNSSDNNNNTNTSDTKLSFLSTSPPGTSFAPMFAIRDTVKNQNSDSGVSPLWDMNFYGTHQAIIDLPWKVDGFNQQALLTINCREVNNIYGNFTGQKQRFVYVLIQFPRNPEKAYHPTDNPFYWGACSVVTEGSPSGGIVYNSVARSGGGIDSFELSKDGSSSGKASMTFQVVAPDLGYYEDYGINYSKAGGGIVHLPKAMVITVEMNQIDPNLPSSNFRLGKVTFNDRNNSPMVTQQATFANTFSVTDVPDFGLGSFR